MPRTRTPLLSVVIPVHRVEEHLPACLDSVLTGADDAVDVEIVAVDDCSPDGSGRILDDYARRHPRLRVVHLATNVGLGRARNAGLGYARGGYLWFVDGDDWLPPGAVPAVAARLAGTEPDVLVVDHAEVFPDGRTVPGTLAGALAGGEPGPLARRPDLLSLAHSACTKVVRRAFLDRIGLRFHPGWYEDCAYSHPLLLTARRIDTLDRVAYCYRQRAAGAITKSVSDRHFDVFEQYDRMWAAVASAGDGPAPAAGEPARSEVDQFRPRLFRLMVEHLLVIAGNDQRLPPPRRREFFHRLVREYRRRLPDGGYELPGGMAGLKHRLVRWNAYPAYAALRSARRGGGWLRAALRPGLRAARRSRARPARAAEQAEPQPADLVAR